MITLVTFDAAGTLIDHRWDPGAIARDAVTDLGIVVDLEEARDRYERVAAEFRTEQVALEKIGDRQGIHELWSRQMAAWLDAVGADPAIACDALSIFRERAFGPSSHVWSVYPDVFPAVEALRDKGIIIGIISNWDHTLFEVLDNLEMSDLFDFAIASLEFGYEKPDRRIFNEALAQGGAAAEETVHVGDSLEDDFIGATDAGMGALLLDREGSADFSAGRISSLVQVSEVIV
ncbi:MAG: HAD-IA family hydrolase [Fimbriimonadales bacterium]